MSSFLVAAFCPHIWSGGLGSGCLVILFPLKGGEEPTSEHRQILWDYESEEEGCVNDPVKQTVCVSVQQRKMIHVDGEPFALWGNGEELDGVDADRNKFSITQPLMPLSLHLGLIAFSDVILLCISSASICVPFVSFDSTLRFAGILRPWIFFFITPFHHISCRAPPSSLRVCSCFSEIVIADPSIFARRGQGLESFNLLN